VRVRFFERYGWAVFAVLGVIVVLFGAGDIASGGTSLQSGEAVLFNSMTGTTWDELRAANPGAAKFIDYLWRAEGAALVVVGLLTVAISVTALRRGDRWAWYAMWIFPLWITLVYLVFWISLPDLRSGIPVPLISGTVFLVITVATLGLSARRYLRGPEAAQ
jgi:FtsH-binding integral membrane protein